MPRTAYAEIEVGLHRTQPESYDIELRVTDPETEAEVAPVRGHARISLAALDERMLWPEGYGKLLTEQLFGDPAVRAFYGNSKAAFDSRGLLVRLRFLIGPSVPELHGVRWELLNDPETGLPLASSERTLISRFQRSRDWRVVKLRAKSELRALIVVSAPNDIDAWQLAAVDYDGEAARAREGLAGIGANAIAKNDPVTLDRLMDGLRKGVDILYLVCHGRLAEGKEPLLFLQNPRGEAEPVPAGALTQRIQELHEPPRLIVMASCESATAEGGKLAQYALAPRLADAGVPAVVAMQGQITMETVKLAMPVFFRELVRDGQIDRAMAVARGVVRDRPDHWMPALFLRLKSGRLWYEPGFGGDGKNEFEKWKAICAQVRKGEFIPILGPELGEDIAGGTGELANQLAEQHAFPLAAHERGDLAKVTQYIATNQNRVYVQEVVENEFLRRLVGRLEESGGDGTKTRSEYLDLAVARCLANPEHPYRTLSELPAVVYVNAGYDTLLYRSLKAAGRNPEAVFAPWRGIEVPKQPAPRNLSPTPQEPWVYHIFGLHGKPYRDTMVLTEDDFFDYLIASSRLDLLLPGLAGRLMQSSLLFLGFRLDDWRFRVLFRLIVTRQGAETMKELSHVGVQVDPDEQSLADVKRARKYMESYFQGDATAPEISIYWGSAGDFLKELTRKMEAAQKDEGPMIANGGDDDWL